MANFSQINLDLQGVLKRTYADLLYRSSFMNFLNEDYIGEIRNTGVPIIEVMKTNAPTVNARQKVELESGLTPALVTYDSVKVDLTELRMDFSFRIPVLVTGSNIASAIDSAIREKDSEMATTIDTYGYGKLGTNEDIEEVQWAPATKEAYIDAINNIKAKLFNAKVYDTYRLGLDVTEYAHYVSALTSVLKFETLAGVEGVDRGEIANAYGVDAFPIASAVLKNDEIGYCGNPVAVVGDAFFTETNQFNGNYPGFPGYYVVEGNVLFGAEVVRPEAIVRLVAEISG
jgi:hypothetical protein